VAEKCLGLEAEEVLGDGCPPPCELGIGCRQVDDLNLKRPGNIRSSLKLDYPKSKDEYMNVDV
jgi:hypothetical protein